MTLTFGLRKYLKYNILNLSTAYNDRKQKPTDISKVFLTNVPHVGRRDSI